jgi:hypothetical protein
MNPNRSRYTLVTLLTVAGMAGCQDTGPKNETFFVQDETHSVMAAFDRQAANGSRHDAMLREQHFDGGRLNSLGRAKLDRMMMSPGMVTIYLPGPVEGARRDAIVAYVKDHGRSENDVVIKDGINNAVVHMAGPELARMKKTELGNSGQQGTDSSNDVGLSGGANGASSSPTLAGKTGG